MPDTQARTLPCYHHEANTKRIEHLEEGNHHVWEEMKGMKGDTKEEFKAVREDMEKMESRLRTKIQGMEDRISGQVEEVAVCVRNLKTDRLSDRAWVKVGKWATGIVAFGLTMTGTILAVLKFLDHMAPNPHP